MSSAISMIRMRNQRRMMSKNIKKRRKNQRKMKRKERLRKKLRRQNGRSIMMSLTKGSSISRKLGSRLEQS